MSLADEISLKKAEFLEKNVFYALTNLNNGFDAPSIKYFSDTDFKIILNRVKKLKIGIWGIEPWKNGEYYDALGYEDFTDDPTDPEWYTKAFESFRLEQLELYYSATYFIPKEILESWDSYSEPKNKSST